MKKIFFSVVSSVFLFFFAFFLVTKINAAPPTPTPQDKSKAAYSLVCMKMDASIKPSCNGEVPCIDMPAGQPYPGGTATDHTAKISASGFPPNIDVYLVGCVGTADNFKCTAGSAALDTQVRALGFQIQPYPGHSFQTLANPVKSGADGTISTFVRSATPTGMGHAFYGVYATGADVKSGDASTLQYGTFDFNQDASKCVSIHWDPKGRVFDSQSLEPLPDAQVQLLDKDKKIFTNISGVSFSKNTEADGAFSFYVPNGTYYLSVARTGHTFPVLMSAINQNYKKAYFCDRSSLNNFSIYNQQYPIVEKDRLTHCDVPMTATGVPYRVAPTLLSYSSNAVPRTTVTIFSGVVSHPLTVVALIGTTSGTEYARVTADKFGDWQITVNNKDLPTDESLKVRLIKTNLGSVPNPKVTLLNSLVSLLARPVVALTQDETVETNVTLDPILRYVEGYAYDAAGNVLPNAKVTVKLQMSGRAEYQTTADSTGYFAILPQYLPIFAYYLEVTPTGSSTPLKVTTTEFVKKNKTYLASNKINLLTATKNNIVVGGSAAPPANMATSTTTATNQQNNQGTVTNESPAPTAAVAGSQNNNGMLAAVLVVFVLVIAGVVGMYLYLRKKQEMNQGPPPTMPV